MQIRCPLGNFMLAVVKGIEPEDEVESMLAAQMAAVHMATMKFARRLNHVENLSQQDSAERTFNKLARTFTTQVEALKRYRTGGQQRMVASRSGHSSRPHSAGDPGTARSCAGTDRPGDARGRAVRAHQPRQI